MRTKKHEYIINMWSGPLTVPLFRTTSREEWLDKIREAVFDYDIQKTQCRIVERKDATYFSFPTDKAGKTTWYEAGFISRPIDWYYGLPKELRR